MSAPLPWWRGPAWALAIALSAAALYYLLIGLDEGVAYAGISFLFLTPALLSAFVCALADPYARWPSETYLKVPVVMVVLTAVVAFAAFREGLICLVILALPWLGSGMLGVGLFYRLRRRVEGVRLNAGVMLLVPLLLIQAEAAVPPTWQQRTVERSIDIAAPPERIWPLLLALPRIDAGEGQWNVSQNVLRVPRPVSAVVRAGAAGPVRVARWQDGIVFAEALTRVEPGRALEWRFLFPDPTLHHHVDRHIDPRGPLLDIETGGYRLERLDGGGTRLTLTTRYRLRSRAAPYAALWGELVLGDVQDNILAIVAGRAA